jgi:transcriptional regulator with XRE-family HTH domain
MQQTEGAKLLKEWMAAKGLSSDKVGDLVGVDGVSVNNWLRGKVPKLASATRLEAIAGISHLAWLHPDDGSESESEIESDDDPMQAS